MNRRRYLSIGSMCAISSLAGCLSSFESDVQLASVNATNTSDEERTVEVRVLDDDSEIQHTELRLDPPESVEGSGQVTPAEKVDCVWDSESKPYTVEARLDEEWESFDVASEADADCVTVTIEIGPSPGLNIRFLTFSCEDLDESDEEAVCQFVELD